MNIFFLDRDPQVCAVYHNDKHVVKMIVESAQMLSACHRFGKVNSTEILLLDMLSRAPQNIEQYLMTESPQVVDDSCRVVGDSVAAYRNYYRTMKLHFSKYTNREVPGFMNLIEEN